MGLYVDVNTLKMEYEERIRKRREPYAKGPFFGTRSKPRKGEQAGLVQALQSAARAVAALLA
jgi:hypothetical protein